ncbi:flagellar hook-associated protein 3 [Anaerosacchariphilus polymeriproducens]|uniref:Flagellar hook-associated protein 3 n=2 Tax=Anaerosacchariphilus polymeriproducens TaxID=1812858 RepID=A0A371AQW9_9FIRM|nr:flagellar hook-associated protein 3 [Anaerosacchariphilus polymeriproducens]
MMTNNSLNNINNNKLSVDKLNNQMSTQKKISRPSEDPVVAIRALRLRSTLTEINQYYQKNIPDATSWLEVTESSLSSVHEILNKVYSQCVYGSTDTLEAEDRNTILQDLTALSEQIYEEGNADYAGRYVFTGYKTNTSLTFKTEDKTTSYTITEKFSGSDIEAMTYITNKQDVSYGTLAGAVTLPDSEQVHRLRLSYSDVERVPQYNTDGSIKKDGLGNTLYENMYVNYTDASGNPQQIAVNYTPLASTGDAAYLPAAGINFIPETGELILSENAVNTLQGLKDGISISYQKTGFDKGEIRPEHYFDCINRTTKVSYTKEEQDIEYTISFNQTLKVNTEASEVLNASIGRDINDLINTVSSSIQADKKVADIKAMLKDSQFQDEVSQAKLNEMLTAAQKEADIAEDNMQKRFSKGITSVQSYLDKVNLAITDCGTRSSRLDITKNRLSSQQTTFEDLKSKNENVELSDVMIEYTAASTAYDASLVAASKTLQNSLLNYL